MPFLQNLYSERKGIKMEEKKKTENLSAVQQIRDPETAKLPAQPDKSASFVDAAEELQNIAKTKAAAQPEKAESVEDTVEESQSAEKAKTAAHPGIALRIEDAVKESQEKDKPGVSMPHDKGYKKSLSRPSEFLHFLKKYVGADWMMNLKASDLSLCDKEMLERDYEGKEADLLYRVSMPAGRDVFIFILQELQSYVDYTMIFRILVYVVNTLVKYFLDKPKNEREQSRFRLPSIIPIVFYNGQERWTAARSLREYQNNGELFGSHILNLEYYLVNLAEIEEEYILSTNTLLDNIMYCDKFRSKLELVGALRAACGRINELGLQAREEFRNWVEFILLSVCGNKKAVVEEILNWAGNGEDDMAFKYNIIRMVEEERAEGEKKGKILKLISLIRKKIRKNNSVDEIADMLEEEPAFIIPIYDLIQMHPDWDDEKISSELKNPSEKL